MSQVDKSKPVEFKPVYEVHHHEENEGEKEYTLPSQGTDTVGKLDEKESPFPKKVSGKGKQREKQTPPPSIKSSVLSKLERSSFVRDEIKEQVAEELTCTKSECGKSIKEYLSGDYEIVMKERTSASMKRDALSDLINSEFVDKELAEIMKEAEGTLFLQSIEDREIAKVFLAMSMSAAYPNQAIATLGNLMSSLTTPAAISLAAGGISNIAAFAAKWALKVAKENPQFAQQLANVLSNISVNFAECLHSHGETLVGHMHEGAPETHGASPVSNHTHQVETTETMQVVKDGEVVDEFHVHVVENVPDEGHEYEHITANYAATKTIQDVSQSANSVLKKAEDINERHLIEKEEAKKLAEGRGDIDSRLARAENPQQKDDLSAQKSAADPSFIARA